MKQTVRFEGMEITRQTIVFDAADIDAEADFWAGVFNGRAEGDHHWQVVRCSDGSIPVGVQFAPDHKPVNWPDNPVRSHMDLWVTDIRAAHAKVLDLGAEIIQLAEGEQKFNVYADPSGHPFCLCW